jgi:diguanylate cyclase (GGDEF)-like protein/PAS domain S-box-containing protein
MDSLDVKRPARLSWFEHGHLSNGLDEQDARRIRAAQINAVVHIVPLTLSINFLNAAIIVWAFWDTGANIFLAVWGALFALLVSLSIPSWKRTRHDRPQGASPRAANRMVLHASILASLWAAVPLVLFPHSDQAHQLIIVCLSAGMISAGAFCLSTLPRAGLAYTWILSLGSAGALLVSGQRSLTVVALLLLLYAVFLSRNLVAHGQLFVDHLRDKMKLTAQSEVIGLLLRDFEQHASDWLWETDSNGALVRVSDRFAEAVGRTPSELQGAHFAEIVGGVLGSPFELEQLLDRMAARLPFNDYILPIQFAQGHYVWSLTAKPVLDNTGQFAGYRGVGADITTKWMAEKRIVRLASYDTVTGLLNRAAFHEAVEESLGMVPRSISLLCLDLDQFKSINDTLGHHIGDALIKCVGERLTETVDAYDVVARIGGDEFAVLHYCDDDGRGTIELAQKIIDAFLVPFTVGERAIAIETSIGIAIGLSDGTDADTLLKRADLALYRAKAAGGGTYRYFKPEMEASAQRRRALEIGLRSALDNGEIKVLFQPLVNLQTGAVVGCEALARWQSLEWGPVSPAEFIPVAEATGLIVPIGEWILRESIKAARGWPNQATVAVNVSPLQFRSQKLLSSVVAALAEGGLPPHRLELEVTESVFLEGCDQTLDILKNLRDLGVRIALDDFGTGYSSLSYLQRFQFDKIKIDKSFVDRVVSKDSGTSIIRAIVAMAGALGMSTTAEGVESADQVEALRELGCGTMQGYFFARPSPPQEIAALFERKLGHARVMAAAAENPLALVAVGRSERISKVASA